MLLYSVQCVQSVQCTAYSAREVGSSSGPQSVPAGGAGRAVTARVVTVTIVTALHSEGVRVTRVTTPCTLHINTGVGGKQRSCARLRRPAPPADAMQQCSVTMLRSGGRRGELQSLQHYTAVLHSAA